MSAVYDRYSGMFEPDVFAAIDGASGDPRHEYVREFIAEGIEGYRTRDLRDAILARESRTTASVDGQTVEYRRIPVLIRNEPDRARREALEEARLEIISSTFNPLLLEGLQRTHVVADELLGCSYDAYCEALSGVDFDRLSAVAEELLAGTRDAYEDLLGYYARKELATARGDIQTHDLARLLHGSAFEELFPHESMVDRMNASMSRMGIDLLANGRIELDLEDRKSKTPRAFCAPIRIPDEIKLVLQPYGGYDDYTTLLHELGHALHFANVDREQPIEFRRLGDNGVTEGYAMTLDHLIQLPEFLTRVVGVARPDEFLRFIAFRELVMLRRYAAKFLYERSLHREGAGMDRAAEYSERLGEATGARTSPVLYLDDVDPHFYCIRYLRAWMLAGALHVSLRERFDSDWFLNPRCGPFLLELWSLGQELPVEALARERLGIDELNFDPLLEIVHGRL